MDHVSETDTADLEIGEVWAVAYGPTIRSLWDTREDAEQEEARCRKLFPLQNRWAMYKMAVKAKQPTEKGP